MKWRVEAADMVDEVLEHFLEELRLVRLEDLKEEVKYGAQQGKTRDQLLEYLGLDDLEDLIRLIEVSMSLRGSKVELLS
jgi:hypothetical protein